MYCALEAYITNNGTTIPSPVDLEQWRNGYQLNGCVRDVGWGSTLFKAKYLILLLWELNLILSDIFDIELTPILLPLQSVQGLHGQRRRSHEPPLGVGRDDGQPAHSTRRPGGGRPSFRGRWRPHYLISYLERRERWPHCLLFYLERWERCSRAKK